MTPMILDSNLYSSLAAIFFSFFFFEVDGFSLATEDILNLVMFVKKPMVRTIYLERL